MLICISAVPTVAQNNQNFCTALNSVLKSLTAKGDWLTKLKGTKLDVPYFLPDNYSSAIKIPGSSISFIHQRREKAKTDSANYYFNAVMESKKVFSKDLLTKFNRLKDSVAGCTKNFTPEEDLYNRYAEHDAYYTRRSGNTAVELSLYFNSNAATWVILLTVEWKLWLDEGDID